MFENSCLNLRLTPEFQVPTPAWHQEWHFQISWFLLEIKISFEKFLILDSKNSWPFKNSWFLPDQNFPTFEILILDPTSKNSSCSSLQLRRPISRAIWGLERCSRGLRKCTRDADFEKYPSFWRVTSGSLWKLAKHLGDLAVFVRIQPVTI